MRFLITGNMDRSQPVGQRSALDYGIANAFSFDPLRAGIVTAPYSPDRERDMRFDDPLHGIEWPEGARGGWPASDAEFHGVEQMRLIQ